MSFIFIPKSGALPVKVSKSAMAMVVWATTGKGSEIIPDAALMRTSGSSVPINPRKSKRIAQVIEEIIPAVEETLPSGVKELRCLSEAMFSGGGLLVKE